MSFATRAFVPDSTALPRAIALRCRKAGDHVAFDQVYLGVPWTCQGSGHITEFQVFIPGREEGPHTEKLGENLFHPCNPEHWHFFTKRPQGEIETIADLDSTCAIARLKRELGSQLMTGRDVPAPAKAAARGAA